MDQLVIRRIKMDDHPNRMDIQWLLFEVGNITQPILCLADWQVNMIIDQVEEQRKNHGEEE